ncbi:DUF2461 domain-containing protein [soil metagenome]
MLQKDTVKFLKDLRKNNTREWFAIHKDRYDAAREDYNAFIGKLIVQTSKAEPRLAELEPKNCVFRIYRDVRFSKNKDPYKCNFGASLKVGGKKSGNCGLYFHVEPGRSFLAAGFWMPEAPELKLLRQEVEYNTEEFKGILKNKNFKKWFGELEDTKLKNAPKGVDPTHPDIELMKYTSYIVSHPIEDKELTSPSLLKACADGHKILIPFIEFLNKAVH